MDEKNLDPKPAAEPGAPFAGRGVFAQPGVEPPMNTIFAQLRDLWKRQGHGDSFTALANALGVHPQHASQWATGSDGRRPPWHVIMALLDVTGSKLVADAGSWRIVTSEEAGG